jgi:hypothetical protein
MVVTSIIPLFLAITGIQARTGDPIPIRGVFADREKHRFLLVQENAGKYDHYTGG